MPDLPRPAGLLDVEGVPAALLATLEGAALPAAPDTPSVAVLSKGPESSAWFEHRMLGEEMGVPVAVSTEILLDGVLYLLREGRRRRIDVLYLRIDEEALLHAAGADGRPLGPSLRAAVDAGRVALANAPGNGVGDDKAVCAFVPAMIEYYLGERATLASVPTYLCADPDQRAAVPRHADLRAFVFHGHPEQGGLSVAPAALTRVAPAGSMVVNSSRRRLRGHVGPGGVRPAGTTV
jgi:carboxylate-amine ligase